MGCICANMSEVIQHQGIIDSVDGVRVRVRIVQAGACAACSVRGGCMAADNKEKMIDIPVNTVADAASLVQGEDVQVVIAQSMGWKAVLLAYILPFVLLMAVLVVLDRYDIEEAWAGVAAVCAVGLYYIFLSFFKRKLQTQFTFTVNRKSSMM